MLQSMGSQRVGHNLATEQQQEVHSKHSRSARNNDNKFSNNHNNGFMTATC